MVFLGAKEEGKRKRKMREGREMREVAQGEGQEEKRV